MPLVNDAPESTENSYETAVVANVTFTILSLSLATINTFVSLIISLITFWIFYNYEKK